MLPLCKDITVVGNDGWVVELVSSQFYGIYTKSRYAFLV